MGKICVIGSANIDATSIVDEFPNKEGKVNQTGVTKFSPGGKGANQAVAAARLGSKVSFVGCVAKDKGGEAIIKNLKSEGIDTSSVYIIDEPNIYTDGRTIMVKDGENMMFGSGKCISKLTPDKVDESEKEILDADIVMIQLKMPEETIVHTIQLCKELGKPIIVNPAPEDKIDVLVKNELFEQITYITPNEKEAYYLSRYIEEAKNNPDFDHSTVKDKIKIEFENLSRDQRSDIYNNLVVSQPNVIITMGDIGAMYNADGTPKIEEAYKTKCVDDTGAGDTFNGAFATKIAEGKSVSEAICYGNKAASIKVQHECAQPGMPTAEKIVSLENEGHFDKKRKDVGDIGDE